MTWALFKGQFHPGVPLELLTGMLVACLIATIAIIHMLESNKRNWIVGVWALGYVLIILWITVLGRLNHTSSEFSYNLMPLWSIRAIKEGYVETIYEKIYNVILFVPLGVLLGLKKVQLGSSRFTSYLKAIGIGFMISIAIELLQLLTRTGMCETDDVICNTIGVILGAGIQYVINKGYQLIMK